MWSIMPDLPLYPTLSAAECEDDHILCPIQRRIPRSDLDLRVSTYVCVQIDHVSFAAVSARADPN